MSGRPLKIAADGRFHAPLPLRAGTNVFGLVASNSAGFSRVVNLNVDVQDSDGDGPLIVVAPVPNLVLQLPPAGLPLANRQLAVPGVTMRVTSRSTGDRHTDRSRKPSSHITLAVSGRHLDPW